MRNSTERRVYAALVLGAVLVAPAAARAYGVEVPENGSVAMGRAGAFVTRASDRAGLGDWVVDATKFPNGLQPLIRSRLAIPTWRASRMRKSTAS